MAARSRRPAGTTPSAQSYSNLLLSLRPTALPSTASSTDCAGKAETILSASALWSRLEDVSKKVQASSKTGWFFTEKDIDQQDPEILNLLKAKAGVSFEVPKTYTGLVKNYLSKGGGGFIVTSMFATLLYRMSLISVYPLGIGDVLCYIGTRVFWEAQEWFIHSRWFHGGENFRAHPLFKNHDRHHDLPYDHISVEPLRLVIVWWTAILVPLILSVRFLGFLSPAIASTFFFSYKFNAFIYSMCHSKIPFKGRMKRARENHIKHHMSPAHHLNMGPNNIDRLMKTHSYDTRLHRRQSTGGARKE